jgi:hypothetical protein
MTVTSRAAGNSTTFVTTGSGDSSVQREIQQKKSVGSLETFLESFVRITLAGFGASLVGLAQERQGMGSLDPLPKSRRQGASTGMLGMTKGQNLPLTWAFSAMLFVAVLESSRVASPTTTIWDAVVSQRDDEENQSMTFDYKKTGIIAFGDYAFGGGVAGVAGAWGGRNRQLLGSARPPSVAWGLRMGLALGCVAGVCQALLNVGEQYLVQQPQKQE